MGTLGCSWMSLTFCQDIPGSQGLVPVASQCWALLWLLSLWGKWGCYKIHVLNESILEPEVCKEITSKWDEKPVCWKAVDLSRITFKRIDLFYLTLWEWLNKTQQPQKLSSLFHVLQAGLSELSPWNENHHWWNFVAKFGTDYFEVSDFQALFQSWQESRAFYWFNDFFFFIVPIITCFINCG